MDDKNQNKTVHNDGITLPEHDFAGLSQVIQSSKPSLPGTENGFVPLNASDLRKPYEDIARHLDKRQERLNNSPIDPANEIAELKEAKKKLIDLHEGDYEQRITDRDTGYRDRMGEWRDHFTEASQLKDIELRIWRERAEELRTKNQELERQRDEAIQRCFDQRTADLREFHDQRMADLERHHARELELTERYTEKLERKLETDETQIKDDKKELHEDRKNLFKTVLASINNFSLAKLFK